MDTPYVSPDTDYNNFADDDEYTGSPLKRFLKGAGAPSPNPSVAHDPSLLPASAKTSGPMLVPTGVAPNGRMNVGPDTSTATKDSPTATTVANLAGNQPVQPPDGIGQRLSKLHGPPTPPQMNPDYPKVNDDLRQAETPLNRTDPKYKMGVGGRIGGAILNLMSGGIPGAIRGAIDPSTPGFYGKGAVNSQFTRDEMARQSRVAGDQAKVKSYDDEYSQAEKGYGHDITAYNDEARAAGTADLRDIQNQRDQEKARHDQAMEDVRQQLADAKDPETKMRAEQRARSTFADELKLPQGNARNSYILTGKFPDDETTAAKLQAAEEKLGIMRDRLALDKEKEAHKQSRNSATFKDSQAIDKYSDSWYMKQRGQVTKEKADALKVAGGDPKKAQDDYTNIEASYNQRKTEFENRKKQWYDQVKGGKSVSVSEPEGGGVPSVDGETAVPATTDSNGQPLAAIPAPVAPVRTAPTPATATPSPTPNATPSPTPSKAKPSPATAQTQTQKTISKADVQKLATKNGMDYARAEKQFKSKGYTIQ